MTVHWVRTAKASNEKVPQAIGWAKEMAGFAKKAFGIDKIEVSMAVTGQTGVLRWEIVFPDMKVLEEKLGMVMTNDDYWKMMRKAFDDDLFEEGKASDEIFRVL